jgi:aryl-alcohol dehydrogenase-like predicted oxidoreductase
MEQRPLGWTDLSLTRIGLGTWAQGGGGWRYSWGPQDDQESIAAIHGALDEGINWVDTAPVYGLGHAEEVLGSALKDLPRTDWPLVATKCGRDWDAEGTLSANLKRRRIRQEIEDSLRRLGTETIDLYQIHWPQPEEDIEEGWGAIADAVRQGKIRYAGVCNFSAAQIERVRGIHPVASLQPPYSLLQRQAEEELLPYCAEHRIGVVAYSPMQKGMLTGAFSVQRVRNLAKDDHRLQDPLFRDPLLTPTLRFVDNLSILARKEGLTTAQLALGWVLRRSEVTSAIVGARRPSQIQETAAAGDVQVSKETLAAIDDLLEKRQSAIRG